MFLERLIILGRLTKSFVVVICSVIKEKWGRLFTMDFTTSKLHNVLVTSDLHYLKSSVSYVSSGVSRIFQGQGRGGGGRRELKGSVFCRGFRCHTCVNCNIGDHGTHVWRHKILSDNIKSVSLSPSVNGPLACYFVQLIPKTAWKWQKLDREEGRGSP